MVPPRRGFDLAEGFPSGWMPASPPFPRLFFFELPIFPEAFHDPPNLRNSAHTQKAFRRNHFALPHFFVHVLTTGPSLFLVQRVETPFIEMPSPRASCPSSPLRLFAFEGLSSPPTAPRGGESSWETPRLFFLPVFPWVFFRHLFPPSHLFF